MDYATYKQELLRLWAIECKEDVTFLWPEELLTMRQIQQAIAALDPAIVAEYENRRRHESMESIRRQAAER